jgi:drug/metabolite transporter superfamily protein YnfA
MEYFESTILLTVVSSFLFVLADLPEIIGPLLFCCTMTSIVPISMTSPFIVLLEAVAIYSPAGLVSLWGQVVQQSCWACARGPD